MRKLCFPVMLFAVLVFECGVLSPVLAEDGANDVPAIKPIAVTAEEAFWAVQTGTDPLSGDEAKVALVDVRTRAEYFWVGAASEVTLITLLNGKTYEPDSGYARLTKDGRFLEFYVNGFLRRVPVKKVDAVSVSPIAKSIPIEFWDENNPQSSGMTINENFGSALTALAGEGFDTVIFFCRSGGRSESCVSSVSFPVDTFKAYYEIDHPDSEAGGLGGFEGTSYGNVYNGYRGFPGRITSTQEFESVSWKDSGLPIKTSAVPTF